MLPDSTLYTPHPYLRRLLTRNTKENLLAIVKEWFAHDLTKPRPPAEAEYDDDEEETTWEDYELLESESRRKIVDRIYFRDWKDGLCYLQVAQLDLEYYQTHSTIRTWKALKLCWLGVGDKREGPVQRKMHLNAEQFRLRMSKLLAPYFKHHIYVKPHSPTGTLWIRVSIHDGVPLNQIPPAACVLYLVWFVNSEYLLTGTVKTEYKDYVLQALLGVFECDRVDEWDLKGRNVSSLQELLLYRDSQGGFSKYRLNQVDDNPLVHYSRKKQKLDDGPKYVNDDEPIMAEDMSSISARYSEVDDRFGRNEQPSLERIEIKLALPLVIKTAEDSVEDLPITIKVKLEGTNVMEGVKRMTALGMAEAPLPDFLGELHSLAGSSLVVDENGTHVKGRE
ncbi:uncharacterized protein VTP21DRAFT_5402 [Calcarisporiella thermophila]|uniref:uncharacterized protein n=1 Tax=Calcarisporiella thermophila TaxID=911321 RepID=UPI003742B9D0